MCGIFGLVVKKNAGYRDRFIKECLTTLARLSEARGKDSSGFAFRNDASKTIDVIRAPMPISDLIKQKAFLGEFERQFVSDDHNRKKVFTPKYFAAIGHSRLVTNGTQLNDENNQPVIKDGLVGVHNGIIVNVDELWQNTSIGKRQFEIDTEVMFALFKHYDETLCSSDLSISKSLQQIVGTVATGFFVDNRNELVLATNNGSLYFMSSSRDLFMFASEKHILERTKNKLRLGRTSPDLKVIQVKANTGYLINLDDLSINRFGISDNKIEAFLSPHIEKYKIHLKSLNDHVNNKSLLVDLNKIIINSKAKHEKKLLEYNHAEIFKLRRCTKCLLVETFPFISYNEEGVCNYCNNYKLKNQPKSLDDLFALIEPYRSKDGSYDSIVPYSGEW